MTEKPETKPETSDRVRFERDVRQPLDEFHTHEVLDRLHVVLCVIDDHLLDHPFTTANPSVEKKIQDASKILGEAYQEVGRSHLA